MSLAEIPRQAPELPADEWSEQPYPDLHYNTLGLDVVRAAFRAADVARRADDPYAELPAVRERLQRLQPHQWTRLKRYCGLSVYENLERIEAPAPDNDRTWAAWLGWEADEEQLIGFLQWHADTLAQHQRDPGVQEEIEIQREDFKAKVPAGLAAGWLHLTARNAIERADKIKFYIGDVFDTHLLGMAAYYAPYIDPDSVVIGVGDGLHKENTRANVKRSAHHELNHATLGWLPSWLLNEAFTEHIAQALNHGQPYVLDPDERAHDQGSYRGVRAFVADLLRKGADPVPVMLGTRGYSDQGSGFARAVFLHSLNRSLARRFGVEDSRASQMLPALSHHLERLTAQRQEPTITAARKAAARVAHKQFLERPETVFPGVVEPRPHFVAAGTFKSAS